MRSNLTFLFVAAVVGLACGGSTSSTPSTPSLAQSTSDLGTTACDRLAKCEPLSIATTYGGDKASCVRILAGAEQSAAALPGSGVTPENVEACAKALAAQGCEDPAWPAACALSGTVPTGGACSSSVQCVAGDGCTATLQTCGTCVVLPKEGEPCPVGMCATGLECFPNGTSSQCVAPVPQGGHCDGVLHLCTSGLQCVSGACAALLGAGAACDPTNDACDYTQGMYCGTSATCTKVTTATVGQACSTVSPQILCAGLGVACVLSSQLTPQSGTCVAPLADGQACTVVGPMCTPPSACLNGVCAKPSLPVCGAADGGGH